MRAKNAAQFLPTFLKHFFGRLGKLLKNTENGQKKWANGQKFSPFWPAKTQCFQGFRGFLPKNPKVFLTIMKKNVKIIYKLKIKVGFWPGSIFRKKFREQKLKQALQLLLFFPREMLYTDYKQVLSAYYRNRRNTYGKK